MPFQSQIGPSILHSLLLSWQIWCIRRCSYQLGAVLLFETTAWVFSGFPVDVVNFAWSSETTEVPFKYIPPDVAGLAAIPSFGFGALIAGVMVTFAHLGRKTRMLNGQLPQGELVEQLSDYPGGFSLVCWIFLVHSITRRVHRILTTQVGQDMYRLHHFVLKSLRCGLRRQRSTVPPWIWDWKLSQASVITINCLTKTHWCWGTSKQPFW